MMVTDLMLATGKQSAVNELDGIPNIPIIPSSFIQLAVANEFLGAV